MYLARIHGPGNLPVENDHFCTANKPIGGKNMRSKRLLAMLLALCMVLSVFSPAALAVEAGSETVLNAAPEAENNENNNASSKENDLLISLRISSATRT